MIPRDEKILRIITNITLTNSFKQFLTEYRNFPNLQSMSSGIFELYLQEDTVELIHAIFSKA